MSRPKMHLSEEQLFTRQINYTIIRHLWNNIEKPSVFKEIRLYTLLDLTANRYSDIVGGNPTNLGASELKHMKQRTGLSEDIFDGKEMLDLKIPDLSDARKSYVSVGRDLWEDYFAEKIYEKRINKSKPILNALKKLDADYIIEHYLESDNMFRLLTYFLTGKPATDNPIFLELDAIGNRVKNITWEKLAKMSNDDYAVLTRYIENLTQALELASAFKVYTQRKR